MQYSCENCGRVYESKLEENGGLEFCPLCDKLNLLLPDSEFSFVIFGEYKIEERLGEGGNATVVKARHMPTGNVCALKLYSSPASQDSNAYNEFKAEVETASEIKHENVVRIDNYGELDNTLFMAMEYIDGMDLGVYIENYGAMAPADATAACIQTCYALDYVWSNYLMIHRDVKPHNIIITSLGDVKLCDFGLTSSHGTAVSEGKKIIGTPFYLSPEMIEMDNYQDNRSDVYSLGCTLFHLLTGNPPFNYGSVLQVVKARLTEDPPKVSDYNPLVEDDLSRVVEVMMSRDPDHRYATASEAADDLLRVRRGIPPHLVNPNRERLNQ